MRVISGSAKGRRLLPVPGAGTRPITDRVKESLFNILGPDVRGATFLDLFAGTGAVAIEALSRGAEYAVLIDKVRKAQTTILKNLENTGLVDRAQVIRGDAFRYIGAETQAEAFDYIYIAPPQYQGMWAKALRDVDAKPSLLDIQGQVIVQIHPKEYEVFDLCHLVLVDERIYGSTALYFYELKSPEVEEDST